MKKILQISNYYYPHIGGIEKTAQYLAEGMKNFETRVVCFGDNNYVEEGINGIVIYRMKTNFKIASQSISFQYYRKLKKIVDEFNPDAIFLPAPNPFLCYMVLNLVGNRKLAVLWHSDIIKQSKLYTLVKKQENKLLCRSDAIFVTSPIYKDNSIPLRPYKDKIKILPSAIDITKFDVKSERIDKIADEIMNQATRPIVLFVGRHVPYKGLQYLVEAGKHLKTDCTIVIAGTGPLTDSLKAVADNRFEFVGRIDDDTLKAYLRVADIFAFPSITKNEAFGLALVEAMYCKCVPVTFSIPGSGVNWVSLHGVTGLEVENSNAIQLAAAIDTLLNDSQLREGMAEKAHQRVIDNFTTDVEIKIANQLFNDLLCEDDNNIKNYKV